MDLSLENIRGETVLSGRYDNEDIVDLDRPATTVEEALAQLERMSLQADSPAMLLTFKPGVDKLLLELIEDVNFSSINPWYFCNRGIRSLRKPFVEDDVLMGGILWPDFDCVGATLNLKSRILSYLESTDSSG